MPAKTKSDARREQLLAAAAKVIGERGFAETRLADVAREIGVSPALVVYYFSTRDRLLIEALRYSEDCYYTAVSEHLAGLTTARDRLDAVIRVTCASEPALGLPPGWVLWFELWVQSVRNPAAASDRAELDARWRTTVADIVRGGQDAGEFAVVDADRFAQMLSALLDGLSVQVALEDETVTADRAISLAGEFCEVMLGAPPLVRRSRSRARTLHTEPV